MPYERFRKNGYFKVIDIISPDGKFHSTTRVAQKGLDYDCIYININRMLEIILNRLHCKFTHRPYPCYHIGSISQGADEYET